MWADQLDTGITTVALVVLAALTTAYYFLSGKRKAPAPDEGCGGAHDRAVNAAAEQADHGGRCDMTMTMRMLEAIEANSAKLVGEAVSAGGGLHSPLRGACGITAPQLASLLGKVDSLRELQRLGADCLECSPNRMLGGCCIHAAALGGHEHTMQYLIKDSGLYNDQGSGAAIDAPLLNGMTALFLAAQSGHLQIVKMLVEASADATFTRRDGSSCLFVSSKNGHTEVVQYLLSNCDVRRRIQELTVIKGMQYSGATALWVAAEKGRLDIMRLLLSADPDGEATDVADIHAKNIAGVTPLMYVSPQCFCGWVRQD